MTSYLDPVRFCEGIGRIITTLIGNPYDLQ
jgi:hypothetical protein